MQVECEKCSVIFKSKLALCPKNYEGCCVAHFDSESFICPCGHDMGPSVVKCIKEGRIEERPGISIINTHAIEKINFE